MFTPRGHATTPALTAALSSRTCPRRLRATLNLTLRTAVECVPDAQRRCGGLPSLSINWRLTISITVFLLMLRLRPIRR
jgi:hypothetical protein